LPIDFTVHVIDTTAPTLTAPSHALLEATTPAGAPHVFAATATDLVDGTVMPQCVPSSGSTFALGTTTVACVATDAHGNTATATFLVTVRDTTPPLVTAPAAITIAATEAAGARGNISGDLASQQLQAFVLGGAATDLADSAPARELAEAMIDNALVAVTVETRFPVGTTPVTFRFHDASGNIGSASSTVTVSAPAGGIVDAADQIVGATNAANVPQPVTASFAGVTQPGLLTAEVIIAPPDAPAGFDFVGAVYDVRTTALVVPPVAVCLVGAFPTDGRLVRYESGAWSDVTGVASDTGLCATVEVLSPIAVIEAAAPSVDSID
jgi:hypothetical protein